MKQIYSGLFLLMLALGSSAQTWNENVGSIIYNSCATCHRAGGIAPFELTSYDDAVSYADEIAEVTESGEMPPWPADHTYRHFTNEKILSDGEINAITDWVANGTPQGTGIAPVLPSFNDGAQMDDPDFVWEVGDYTVPSNEDYYRTFVIPMNNTETEFISGYEFIPGNGSIVHHYLLFHDATNEAVELDEAAPGLGFPTNGADFPVESATLIAAWAPGGTYNGELPLPVGSEVPPNSNLILEIHFAPGGQDQTDNSEIRVKFRDGTDIRPLYNDPILYHTPPCLQEPWLIIPANTTPTFHQVSEPLPLDVTVFTLFPHMHNLGQTYKVWLITEENDSIPVLNIDHWDFHWQYGYLVQQPLVFPAGSVIYAEALYDNTVNNDDNPNDPPELVLLGENTDDEMMLVFFEYTYYLPGDEDVIIDSTLLNTPNQPTLENLLFYPNPATGKFYANIYDYETLEVFDQLGKRVFHVLQQDDSDGWVKADLSACNAGIYTAVVTTSKGVMTQKLVKQ